MKQQRRRRQKMYRGVTLCLEAICEDSSQLLSGWVSVVSKDVSCEPCAAQHARQ
jgi:hypothetical protein